MTNNIFENARKKHAITKWRKKFLPSPLQKQPTPNPLKEFVENEKRDNCVLLDGS